MVDTPDEVAAIVEAAVEQVVSPAARCQLERQARSNGSRQASGAISWWIAFGPQEPGAYGRTGGGFSSSGFDRSHRLSMPSARA